MDHILASKIVELFKNSYPNLIVDDDVIGIQISVGDPPTLEVLVSQGRFHADFAKDRAIPDVFQFEIDKQRDQVGVRFRVSDLPFAQQQQAYAPRSGDTTRGVGLVGWGTGGWALILDGRPILVSNWHVLCPDGNATQIGTRVEAIDPSTGNWELVGHLADFEPIHEGRANNKWDFAYAELINDAIPGRMRACADGMEHHNPRRLSTVVDGNNNGYYKVGARAPICRSGKLIAYGASRLVDYHGPKHWFIDQLVFEKMTSPGDSGSIVIRQNDNSVAGLNFAGTLDGAQVQESIANPLYKRGWEYVGTRWLNEVEVPSFRTNDTLPKNETSNLLTNPTFQVSTNPLHEIFARGLVVVNPLPWNQPPYGKFNIERVIGDGWASTSIGWVCLSNPQFSIGIGPRFGESNPSGISFNNVETNRLHEIFAGRSVQVLPLSYAHPPYSGSFNVERVLGDGWAEGSFHNPNSKPDTPLIKGWAYLPNPNFFITITPN